MKNIFYNVFVASVLCVLCAATAHAQCTYTAQADGLFSFPGTFVATGTLADGTSCPDVPVSNSSSVFIIGQGYTVTLNSTYIVGAGGSITVSGGGTLVIADGGVLTLSGTGTAITSLIIEEKSALVVKSGGIIQGGNLMLGSGSGSDKQTTFDIAGGGMVMFDQVIVNKATITVNLGARLDTRCNLVLLSSDIIDNGKISVGGNLDLSKGGASNRICGIGDLVIKGCVFGTNGDKQKISAGCDLLKVCVLLGTGLGCPDPLSATNAEERDCSNPFTSCTNPLSVKLISFTATATAQQGVALRWVTASEKNNASFAVERSADGRSFRSIHRVPGGGTVQSRSDYLVVDENPLPGTSYYRLRQTDFDGTSTYSPVCNVARGRASAQSLQVYPGRVAQEWVVNSTLPAELLTGANSVTVYDAMGRAQQVPCHADAAEAGRWALDVRALPVGIYIVRLVTSRGAFSQRMVK